MIERTEHCHFAVLDPSGTGKCIAHCIHNNFTTDCIGKERETITEYRKRLEAERGTH